MVTANKDIFRPFALFVLGSLGPCFVQAQPISDYRLVDGRCDLDQCLFIERAVEDVGYLYYMVGTVRVTGFYGNIVREGSSAETITPRKTLVCPAFKVMSAPQFFQRAFRRLIEGDNTVNHLDKEGRLVLAIGFGGLKASEIRHVKGANSQHPVSLTLFKPPPTERDLPKCGSFFNILRVEDAER